VRLTERGLQRVGHGQDVGPADYDAAGDGPRTAGSGPIQLLGPDGALVALATPVGTRVFCIRPWFCANIKSLLASAR
jgi:hypothetical protein